MGRGIPTGEALDFAEGTVVHITSGISALALKVFLGKSKGYGLDSIKPHNVTFTLLGAGLLWFGWFGVHGVGGIIGTLLTGVFASVGATGLLLGNSYQPVLQLEGVVIAIVYASVCTIIIGFVINKTIGLKVSESEENIRLDKTKHGETAYNI
jgi:ammonia channel protein AmtB